MRKLLIITFLILALIGCSASNGAVVIELRLAGDFIDRERIENLQLHFNKIENVTSRNLVFIIHSGVAAERLIEVMDSSKEAGFKSVSISSR